jgi:hypothetical protein
MVNAYEVKNWGTPIEDKFFMDDLYVNKCFPSNARPTKKSMKEIKRTEKKKFRHEEADS